MSAFRALLWKDLQMSRGYLIAAAAVLVGPYVFLFFARRVAASDGLIDDGTTAHHAGVMAGVGAVIIASLLSGASFATERTDRSAEFLAYLPVDRARRLASKLLVACTPAVILLVTNPLVVLSFEPASSWVAVSGTESVVATIASTLVLALGTAWLGSVMVSAAAALLLGLLSPFFVTCAFYATATIGEEFCGLHIDLNEWFPTVFRWAGFGIGAVTFLAGSLLFLRQES